MSEIEAQCAGCGATKYDFCVCTQVDQVENGLAGESFYAAAKILRRLGAGDLRKVVSTLQSRAHDRGYREGRMEGERPKGEDRG
jgi:hypothetical protein